MKRDSFESDFQEELRDDILSDRSSQLRQSRLKLLKKKPSSLQLNIEDIRKVSALQLQLFPGNKRGLLTTDTVCRGKGFSISYLWISLDLLFSSGGCWLWGMGPLVYGQVEEPESHWKQVAPHLQRNHCKLPKTSSCQRANRRSRQTSSKTGRCVIISFHNASTVSRPFPRARWLATPS